MTANINPETGIAYGYISANVLDPMVVDELMHGDQATNESYEEAYKEACPLPDDDAEPATWDAYHKACQRFADDWEDYEPTISGELDGVKYSTSWLGGALNFFIFKSPVTTDKARLASPCVPNAGILDTLDGSVTSYDVPADWRNREGEGPWLG